MMQQQAYSVTTVARILGLSRPTVYQAIKRKALPSFRLGGKTMVPRAAIETLLEGGEARKHSEESATNA